MRRDDIAPVAWLMGASALIGAACYFAAPAKADDDAMVRQYADLNATRVCQVLDEFPNNVGVLGLGEAIADETNFTDFQVGRVIADAVLTNCPRHTGLVLRFAAQHTGLVRL